MTKKLYIDNPYLRETNAKVVDKIFKDETYHITLDRTLFHPNMSGGQPKDLGTIDKKQVLDVYEENSSIIHVLREDIDSKDVNLSIDWSNRFDLMQQHTGQHILSSALLKLFNVQTLSFHIGQKYSTIDIGFFDLANKEILQIETLANKIIQSNFNIISEVLDSSKLSELDLSKLPQGEDEIRIVNIENISSSPCSGSHVSNTGEVALLKILNAHNKSKDEIRISFICGNRALQDYFSKHHIIEEISSTLSSGSSEVLDRFLKLKENKENLQIENKVLRDELISLKGNIFLNKKKTINNINYILEDLDDMDKKEIYLISSYLNKETNLIQIYKLKDESQAMFLITRSSNLNIDLQKIFQSISQKIIVNGGGSQDKIQGTTSPTIIDKVVEMFFREVQDYFLKNK